MNYSDPGIWNTNSSLILFMKQSQKAWSVMANRKHCVCSHCVLMTTHELLFYLREHNGVCMCAHMCVCVREGERFTIPFTVKHLFWRMISCINSKCSSSCSHLADAISCHRVNREWESRISVRTKIPRQWVAEREERDRIGDTKAVALTERQHFSTLYCCWQLKDGHGFGLQKVPQRAFWRQFNVAFLLNYVFFSFSFSIRSQLYCTYITRL